MDALMEELRKKSRTNEMMIRMRKGKEIKNQQRAAQWRPCDLSGPGRGHDADGGRVGIKQLI